jgi:type IX secretion system PorP/SprF family membrane protein
MIKKILLIFGFLSLFAIGFSQDVSFSQINSSVLYLNPAFAGSRNCPELSMTYRNHWPSLGSQYVTSVVTYEQYIRDLKSGFGILLMNDRSANGIYSLNSFNTYYSNQQKLTNNLNIKFGLEFSYKQNFIDSKKLFFEDSFNGVAFTNYTNESFLNNFKVNYFDVGTGILLFNDKWFAGLTEPNVNIWRKLLTSKI